MRKFTSLYIFLFLIFLFSCSSPENETIQTPIQQSTTEYTLTVNSGNGGTVSTSGGTYEEGTSVTVTATPNPQYIFTGWSNGSTETSITITVSSNTTIEATFSFDCSTIQSESEQIQIPDFNNMSYLTRINYPEGFKNSIRNLNPEETWNPLDGVVLDYNQDGFLDFVYTNSDYTASFNNIEVRNKILFFKGDCNNDLIIDHNLSNRFDGLIHGRKGIVGDFNNDSYPDIFFAGHGVDVNNPGEYPILLSNIEGLNFEEIRFENLVGFFHTVCSGDYDNDGDLDIILISQGKTYLMKNINGEFDIYQDDINYDWRLNFDYPQETIVPELHQIYTSELFDVDRDGFLDLIVSGHDFPAENTDFVQESYVLYGNGTSFSDRKEILPTVDGFGICIDIDFFDINNDGITEIILNRVSDDSYFRGPYWGSKIQVLEFIDNQYVDSTDKFIDISEFSDEGVIEWIHISDYDDDGIFEMFDDSFSIGSIRLNYEWELIGNQFILKTE